MLQNAPRKMLKNGVGKKRRKKGCYGKGSGDCVKDRSGLSPLPPST